MRIIKNSLLLLVCCLLGGCLTEMLIGSVYSHVDVRDIFLDHGNVILDVGRLKGRTTYPNWEHSHWEPLAARAESYTIARDFSKPEVKTQPTKSVDDLAWFQQGASYQGNPPGFVRTWPQGELLFEKDPRGQQNAQVFPVNRDDVEWLGRGREAYAYLDWQSRRLTYVVYGAAPCAIEPREMPKPRERLALKLAISNDGKYLAAGVQTNDGTQVMVYRGCERIMQAVLPQESSISGVCVTNGEYWFWNGDGLNTNYAAFRSGSNERLVMPKETVSIFLDKPFFDCERKVFIWSEDVNNAKEDGLVDLVQYDPVAIRRDVMHLKLGRAL